MHAPYNSFDNAGLVPTVHRLWWHGQTRRSPEPAGSDYGSGHGELCWHPARGRLCLRLSQRWRSGEQNSIIAHTRCIAAPMSVRFRALLCSGIPSFLGRINLACTVKGVGYTRIADLSWASCVFMAIDLKLYLTVYHNCKLFNTVRKIMLVCVCYFTYRMEMSLWIASKTWRPMSPTWHAQETMVCRFVVVFCYFCKLHGLIKLVV